MKFLNHSGVLAAAAALFITKASATFGDVYATGSGEEEDNFLTGTVSFDDDEYVQYPFSSEGSRAVSSVEEDLFGEDAAAFTKILSDFQTRLEEGGESLEDILGSIDMEQIRSLFEEHRVRGDEL